MKTVIKILVPFSILFINCKSTEKFNGNEISIHDIYYAIGDERKEIHFKENTFTFLDKFSGKDFSYYNCCDTLSKGSFKIINNSIIELTSINDFNSGFLDFNIKEKTTNNLDTLYIKITNPIEKKYNSKTKRELKYMLQLGTNDKELNRYFTYTEINNNLLKIPISNSFEIYDIELTIYVEPFISVKEKNINVINTFNQKIKNKKSNKIEIDVPELTYNYINFRRLKMDYIRVVSENKLIFDGIEYLKK
ncbi:hypothetical protein [Flavobacterium tibetense]|uniref:Uncharacterized protein n=1 Tax=Flavobacterium tibetense TaxID=2233533 RepID=A0A365NZX1_9FLAO|nr:hypothetical protein [Flavobacterium tibetense]RBA27741.1 hypothetical protein DPN68_10425 [Flavobacterium tibetense]